jgi:hypothetical protein
LGSALWFVSEIEKQRSTTVLALLNARSMPKLQQADLFEFFKNRTTIFREICRRLATTKP